MDWLVLLAKVTIFARKRYFISTTFNPKLIWRVGWA